MKFTSRHLFAVIALLAVTATECWAKQPPETGGAALGAEQAGDSKLAKGGNLDAIKWQRSLPLDDRSADIGIIGGTEARALVAMDGKLYAGIGYWSDSKENESELPGAQVLVLDSPTADWKIDFGLNKRVDVGPAAGKRRYFAIATLYGATFKSELNGKMLAKPVHVLLAGAWDRLGQLQVFSKTGNSRQWTTTDLSPVNESRHAEIRSFIVYRDKVTHIEHAFAGTRVNNVADPTRIYSGAFSEAEGKIRWNATPEPWGKNSPDLARTTRSSGRITGFAECNGKLYASVYNMIFERQDGAKASWKFVFKYEPQEPFKQGSSGFRGLTAVSDRSGKHEVLIFSLEHSPCTIFTLNTETLISKVDLNVSEFLQKQWNTKVGYTIAGYNNMLLHKMPGTRETVTLIGFEAATPQLEGKFHHFNSSANYLVRLSNGSYAVRQIVDQALDHQPAMVAVRSLVDSPFSQDPEGTMYAGGFDANRIPVHNTAWIYRGVPRTQP